MEEKRVVTYFGNIIFDGVALYGKEANVNWEKGSVVSLDFGSGKTVEVFKSEVKYV
jgi:hypothetical protein